MNKNVLGLLVFMGGLFLSGCGGGGSSATPQDPVIPVPTPLDADSSSEVVVNTESGLTSITHRVDEESELNSDIIILNRDSGDIGFRGAFALEIITQEVATHEIQFLFRDQMVNFSESKMNFYTSARHTTENLLILLETQGEVTYPDVSYFFIQNKFPKFGTSLKLNSEKQLFSQSSIFSFDSNQNLKRITSTLVSDDTVTQVSSATFEYDETLVQKMNYTTSSETGTCTFDYSNGVFQVLKEDNSDCRSVVDFLMGLRFDFVKTAPKVPTEPSFIPFDRSSMVPVTMNIKNDVVSIYTEGEQTEIVIENFYRNLNGDEFLEFHEYFFIGHSFDFLARDKMIQVTNQNNNDLFQIKQLSKLNSKGKVLVIDELGHDEIGQGFAVNNVFPVQVIYTAPDGIVKTREMTISDGKLKSIYLSDSTGVVTANAKFAYEETHLSIVSYIYNLNEEGVDAPFIGKCSFLYNKNKSAFNDFSDCGSQSQGFEIDEFFY